jgi:hypothetical protein
MTGILTPAEFEGGGGGVDVTSVFGRSGAVIAATGDYTVAQVTGAAPTASPAFTGTPTGVSGQYIVPPVSYAPATIQTPTVTTGTYSAFDTANLTTGTFTLPASGKALVRVTLIPKVNASGVFASFGLCLHNTVTPLEGFPWSFEGPTGDAYPPAIPMPFIVSGTPGASVQYDLVGLTSGTALTVEALGNTSLTPGSIQGGPVIFEMIAI